MLIQNYGLFWRASEIDWKPGSGAKGKFRLLGRQGVNSPTLKLADFRFQQGIYVLYGEYGPYYVGLTRRQGFGQRLKQHLQDDHEGLWDRFSWFGFRATLLPNKKTGICPLRKLAELSAGNPSDIIADMEALLIKAMGPSNVADMKFRKATPWIQVQLDQVSKYVSRAAT